MYDAKPELLNRVWCVQVSVVGPDAETVQVGSGTKSGAAGMLIKGFINTNPPTTLRSSHRRLLERRVNHIQSGVRFR
jgi:hypothetical protein